MEIKKGRDIRIKLTWCGFLALVFSTCLCYFLGWTFDIKSLFIVIAIVIGEFILLWILCFLLIKLDTRKYEIDSEAIKLYKNNQQIFVLESHHITQIRYIRFFWTFLLQFGSGYLNITYKSIEEDKKFSTILPSGEKMHSISMSLSQALKVSEILNVKLEIK